MSAALAAGDRMQAGPHIYLVAGEESGDRLGAALMLALREKMKGRVRFSGVGGQDMAAQGFASLFPLGDLAIMGFSAVPASLPKIIRRIRETAVSAIAARPDIVVIIDSPEFTHRVARRVRARAPSIPIVDYVSPSVWAWRPGRARAMRAYIDHVLALLPFEPAAMQRLGGPPCTYVGHPLIERVSEFRPDAGEARRRLDDPPLLLVLPGSRGGEIRRLAPVFGKALAIVAAQAGAFEVVVPSVDRLAGAVRTATASWPVPVRVVTDPAEKHAVFRNARAALTKSGTSTLELAVAGIPMVAAYKVSWLEAIIGQLFVHVPSFILANLVVGENVVPEFLQHYATPKALAAALLPRMADSPARRRQTEAFRRLDVIMEIGTARPSERAGTIVLQYAAGLNQPTPETVASAPPTA